MVIIKEIKMNREIRSARAKCPFCAHHLSGKIEKFKNNYKLDMGDPDYREKTICPNCGKNIFTMHSGTMLEHSYSHVPPASP